MHGSRHGHKINKVLIVTVPCAKKVRASLSQLTLTTLNRAQNEQIFTSSCSLCDPLRVPRERRERQLCGVSPLSSGDTHCSLPSVPPDVYKKDLKPEAYRSRQLLHVRYCAYEVQKEVRLARVGVGIVSLDTILIPCPLILYRQSAGKVSRMGLGIFYTTTTTIRSDESVSIQSGACISSAALFDSGAKLDVSLVVSYSLLCSRSLLCFRL